MTSRNKESIHREHMERRAGYSAQSLFSVSFVIAFCLTLISSARAQPTSIVNSPHNLSASGPGEVRAMAEGEICIFCHTPHNAAPVQPLWNRNVPVNAYTVYSSSSLQAKPGQPTGASKLCLSCHDGTIAVGSVLSREQPIAMAGGITTLPPGHGNLGTDLSDDHPISFRYDTTLSVQNPKVKPPTLLPPGVKLDRNQELQCTSCHDAHNDSFGKFLVMNNTDSQLCKSCHQAGNTTIAVHAECASCHAMHTAPSGAMLLKGVNASETCLACHSSQPTLTPGINVAPDLAKVSRHYNPPNMPAVTGGASIAGSAVPQIDVTCAGCHEPHTMEAATAEAPLISPKLGQVSGVNAAGGKVPVAQYQYEVCFKCHDTAPTGINRISRVIVQTSTRLQFAPAAVSYHPVEAAGKNPEVPSLRPGLTTASLIYCTDCHSSDTGTLIGGGGANGPHGSNVSPLLVARYDTADNTSESETIYALCYRCHDRASILSDQSFSAHRLHVVDQRTPCSVCHDSHGISSAQGNATNNSHLINFDTSVVTPDSVQGKIEYQRIGSRTGLCFLNCHGVDHSPKQYPGENVATPPGPPVSPLARPGAAPTGRKAPLRGPQPIQRGPVRTPAIR